MCIGTGCRWHNYDVSQGPVAYILAEGAGGIRPRVEAWKRFRTWSLPANVRFLLEPVKLLEPAHVADLLRDIRNWEPTPKLIIADTLAHCIAPGDENSTRDMGEFVAAVNEIRRITGATFAAVHHTGWMQGRERGSSAFRGAVDTLIKVESTDRVITLTCDKQRDGAPFPKLRFRLSPIGDSCVVETDSQVPTDVLTENLWKTLQALHEIELPDGVSFTKWLRSSDQSRSTFNRNKNALVEGEWVEKQNQRYYITEKGRETVSPMGVP